MTTTNAPTTSHSATAAELAERLTADGYVNDVPRWLGPDAVLIDCDCAAGADCPGCGRHGMSWSPWYSLEPAPRSYVCLAVCRCGSGFEF